MKAARLPVADPDPIDDGLENARRFERTLSRVLTVSKAELTKREAAYQKSRRRKKSRRVSK